MIASMFGGINVIEPKYKKGQEVIVAPLKDKHACFKRCRLEPYDGKTGKVTEYYWINIGRDVPDIRYIYTVQVEDNYYKEVAVHEDEIKALYGRTWKIPWLRKSQIDSEGTESNPSSCSNRTT
jgi:hypothetical protein